MAPEIGLYLLIIATTLCMLIPATKLLCEKLKIENNYATTLIHLNTFSLCCSVAILGALFVNNDFSVSYVANNSNSQLAPIYKVAAIWSGHEGSMLFWITAMAIWSSWVALKQKSSEKFHEYFYVVTALIMFGFLLFLIFTSNPFARLLPNIPAEGRDLNPILQDIGLILHPPLLFIGYVGLGICFSGAMAALLDKKTQLQQNCKQLRPWAILAWCTLTGGNAFGSWWAYNELGWGGWWFWDPVENASFIPWLISCAMLHSIILSEKRNSHYLSTLFICILGFSTCLLGTFLVRSGVVQSVHAFANDPTRGASILVLFSIVSIAGFTLLAYRFKQLIPTINYELFSKTSMMQLGNLLLLMASLSILLGTCYPLIYEVIASHSISVGAPYFNSLFVPIVLLLSLLMGAAPLTHWQKTEKTTKMTLAISVVIVIALALTLNIVILRSFTFFFFCGALSCLWIVICIALTLWQKYRATTDSRHTRRFYCMCLAHLGVMVSILGATYSSYFQQEELLRMGPGQGKVVAGYTFIYEATEEVETTSYSAIQAKIDVRNGDDEHLTYIYPQRQTFNSNGMQLSAAGIHHGLFADLYISMGNQLSEEEYLIRINYKPMINWIWLGAIMMMFAGIGLLTCRSRQTERLSINQAKALNGGIL